jgi:hypothetical protein
MAEPIKDAALVWARTPLFNTSQDTIMINKKVETVQEALQRN